MAEVRSTTDCHLGILNEATLAMLTVIVALAKPLPFDAVYLTAGTNGDHSGPDDPHYKGWALDIRTHNFPTRLDRYSFCEALLAKLGPKQFFAFVEAPDSPNEHIHVQVKKGTVYPSPTIRVGVPQV